MMVLTVANLKGGTAKTTTTGFLAHALAERGRSVVAIDADPQESLTRWASDAEWPLPVYRMARATLDTELPELLVGRRSCDAVVIDTPPLHPELVAAALRVATHVVIPMAPTSADFDRLDAVAALLAKVAAGRLHGRPPVAAILLTKAVGQASATTVYRELASHTLPVLRTRVGFLQRFAQAIGAPVWDANATGYGDALTELLAMTPEETPR